MACGGVVPVGELSMSRPDEFAQDFDSYYRLQAQHLAQETDGETALYKGTPRERPTHAHGPKL